jgi:hypothetical protein
MRKVISVFIISITTFIGLSNLFAEEYWVACVNWEREPKPFPIIAAQADVTESPDFFEFSFTDDSKAGTKTTIKLEKKDVDQNGLSKASGMTKNKPFLGTGKVTENDASGHPVQFEFRIFKKGADEKPDENVRGLYLFIKKMNFDKKL